MHELPDALAVMKQLPGNSKLNSLGNGKQFSLQHGKQNSLFRTTPVMFFQQYRSRNDKEKNVQTDSKLKEKGLYQEGHSITDGDRPKNISFGKQKYIFSACRK